MPQLPRLESVPTIQDILDSQEPLAPHIHRTPVLFSNQINKIAGCSIFFKAENFQRIGAFKMRGATRAALSLTQEELSRGLITHSSGNHAQAVARTASGLGVPAHIIMPENAPSVKREAARGYGAQITSCKPTMESRVATMLAIQAQTGATFIHPYDDYSVIAGQATACIELMEEVPDLDDMVAPVGGGGLMSGTCLAAHGMAGGMRVFAGEPEEADDAYRSLQMGSPQVNVTANTVADGLKTSLSDKTFGILNQHLEEVMRVSDEEIIEAMRLTWMRMKIIIEPSCAVPLAAILKNRETFEGRRVGVILSGGNVDLDKLPWHISEKELAGVAVRHS